jgi:predicted TIM-barrel fold metal-dependent hydrolase
MSQPTSLSQEPSIQIAAASAKAHHHQTFDCQGPRRVKTEREDAMLTRRAVLFAGAATGPLLALHRDGARAAAPSTVATPVNFDVPRGACDCHVHVFDPAHFPYFGGRVYTPPEATADDLLALQRQLHFDRVVVVQPSVYGVDNACTLDAIRKLGPARARGVAVIDKTIGQGQLDDMAAAGMHGVRLNFETAGESNPDNARRRVLETAEQLRGRGWHIQLNAALPLVTAINDALTAIAVPVVIDHFARTKAKSGINQPGFDVLLALVKSGKAYVKLSATYRISDQPPHYPDAPPIAQALINANPDRMVWGSNWPHPGRGKTREDIAPPHPSDDGAQINQLPTWTSDATIRNKILVDNPARLYGFPA